MKKNLKVFTNADSVDFSSVLSENDKKGLARMFLDMIRRESAQTHETVKQSA